ncbi:MAG TPA: selenium cofactor biosynthesis protein YqeC, partial [bacterium]|nr:selenium cofactor biosynthesis protein YqeC [bacterium]
MVSGLEPAQRALDGAARVRLLASGIEPGAAPGQEKYAGLDPALVDTLRLAPDVVLLVEGDGSRRLPIKAPREHEPVIPFRSRTVLLFMGASAIGQPLDERHCFNHEGALALLGRSESCLGAEEISALAAHPDCGRKGVLPGMAFRLVINQGDLEKARPVAERVLRLAWERSGIQGALASFQEGELYGTSPD